MSQRLIIEKVSTSPLDIKSINYLSNAIDLIHEQSKEIDRVEDKVIRAALSKYLKRESTDDDYKLVTKKFFNVHDYKYILIYKKNYLGTVSRTVFVEYTRIMFKPLKR